MIRFGLRNQTLPLIVVCALALLLAASPTVAQNGPVFPTHKKVAPSSQEPEFPPPGTSRSTNDTKDKIDPVEVDDLPSQAKPAFTPEEPGIDVEVFSPPKPPEMEDDPIEIVPELSTPDSVQTPSLPAGSGAFNVGVAITEAFLNELASDARQEVDSVCDRILGAQVSGTQQTTATTRVDCQRNNRLAQINFVLASITNSNTIGRLPNASVSTEGLHRADLVKPVFFDGRTLTTKRPQGFIKANNMTRGVVTPLSGLPLLGPVATQIAQAQALQSKTASETETASSVARKVVPRFNKSVDERLADANRRLRSELEPWLRSRSLWPDATKCTTTDSELRFRAQYGVSTPDQFPARRLFGRKASLLLHESAINNMVESLGLGGLKVTDRQMQRALSRLGGNTAPAPDVVGEEPIEEDLSEPMLYSLVFADIRPVFVRFVDDAIVVNLRLSIQPAASGASIPMQEIQLAVTPRVDSDRVILEFAEPRVRPADGSTEDSMSNVIRQQIANLIKPVELPASREFEVSAQKRVSATVGRVATSNGWLLLAVN